MKAEGGGAAGRRRERGAALVTSLLVSMMMLTAGGALILTTGMTAGNAIDATAEAQAYYAAEAGLHSALSVLRGNVAPRSGFTPPGGVKMKNNLRTANLLATSNKADDAGTAAGISRLSGWLPYNGTGLNARVPVPGDANTPLFYQVTVEDPDDITRAKINAAATPLYEPHRLLVTATGFGPKGSVKRMQLLINRTQFDFTARSTLLMRGAENCSNMPTFSVGQSNAKEYNGNDKVGLEPSLPVFGTTCAGNQTQVANTVDDSKPNTVTSNAQTVAQVANADLPPWLRSADDARLLLLELAATAEANGRHFTETPDDFGTAASPKFTFVDGDCDLRNGAGLLVVTGTLSMSGNANFNGVILVLGEGAMTRNGGGNGEIMGAIVVAKFARTWPSSENNQPHPFLAPVFDTNGGGNSTVQYHSTNVRDAMNSIGMRILGMVEN